MIKVGTIGTGFIVDWFLTSVKDNEGIECQAVYSRTKEKGEALAVKYDVSKVYTDLDEMLDDPELNFIYVAAPNSLHYEYALKSLLKGKNVILEKPFTEITVQAETLSKLVKENKLFLFEAITTLYMPNYLLIKEKLNDIGRIRMVQCNFSQYSSRYDKLLNNEVTNVFNPNFAGGCLVDLNIYNLHFCCGLFGIPDKINYYANKWQNGIDTSGILILTYPDFFCSLVAAKDSSSANITQIQGEKGYIQVNREVSMCRDVMIKTKDSESHYELQDKMISLYYEVKEFVKLYNAQDYQTCYQALDYSCKVVKLLEQARADAGINYR